MPGFREQAKPKKTKKIEKIYSLPLITSVIWFPNPENINKRNNP
jgi:hypothetical protein